MKPEETRPEPDPESRAARELLERTMRFLARCCEDPEAAVKADDPRELIRGLEAIVREPAPPPAERETPTIPLRRRRSA